MGIDGLEKTDVFDTGGRTVSVKPGSVVHAAHQTWVVGMLLGSRARDQGRPKDMESTLWKAGPILFPNL